MQNINRNIISSLKGKLISARSSIKEKRKLKCASSAKSTNKSAVYDFFFPEPNSLPSDVEMPIWDHLEELRERIILAGSAGAVAIIMCFYFSKDLMVFLEAPVVKRGARFLQLS